MLRAGISAFLDIQIKLKAVDLISGKRPCIHIQVEELLLGLKGLRGQMLEVAVCYRAPILDSEAHTAGCGGLQRGNLNRHLAHAQAGRPEKGGNSRENGS
jgi:hypothetical protein